MIRLLPAVAVVILLSALAAGVSLKNSFRIDSSTDTMVLEEDPEALRYDRNALLFSNDEFVLVGLTRDDLFTPEGVAAVGSLHAAFEGLNDELNRKKGTEGVGYIRDVWSIARPPAVLLRSFKQKVHPFMALQKQATVLSPEVDLAKAKAELTDHELFAQNLISADGRTAGILVTLRVRDESRKALQTKLRLFDRRGLAREQLAAAKSEAEREAARTELAKVASELDAFWPEWVRSEKDRKDERIEIIQAIRRTVHEWRAKGHDIGLSGVPALVVEMVEAINSDLRTFVLLSAAFVCVFLALVFRRIRWVVLPLLATGCTIVFTLALMYGVEKQMTVITGNIPSLLLVIGLAHSVHMIVRYRELTALHPEWEDAQRIKATVASLVWPCLFTATTTAAGFASLYYAGSRPIIDFGFFMAFGVGLAFVLSFVLLPAGMLVLPAKDQGRLERSANALRGLATASLARPKGVLALTALIVALSVWGISRIEVEARFIDYFSPDSPIHKGLKFIDDRLGGTAGMEIVIKSEEGGAFGPDHPENLARAAEVVEWLEDRPEVGAVMSFVGMVDEARKAMPVDRGRAARMLMFSFPPEMIGPYMVREEATVAGRVFKPASAVRITARVKETDPTLRRAKLLREIRAFLAERFPEQGGAATPGEEGAAEQQPLQAEVTGMFVLYANMLASLKGSQVRTSLLAMAAIWVMLALLFRNPFAALLALIPNLIPITFVLGAMGWSGIPLDMATVMIASVSLGIGVDCAIHYLFRYREEVAVDGDVAAAIRRSHGS
ncbi:MAG TPA: hypothetical protein DEA08_02170, partial [Planctomycetes bacterium]|nr:hypothetical protein [Planctomycetota bacterium]